MGGRPSPGGSIYRTAVDLTPAGARAPRPSRQGKGGPLSQAVRRTPRKPSVPRRSNPVGATMAGGRGLSTEQRSVAPHAEEPVSSPSFVLDGRERQSAHDQLAEDLSGLGDLSVKEGPDISRPEMPLLMHTRHPGWPRAPRLGVRRAPGRGPSCVPPHPLSCASNGSMGSPRAMASVI